MKRSAFLFLLAFIAQPVFSQESTYSINLDNTNATEKIAVPFCAVTVLDARYDQAYVGCVAKEMSFKGATKGKTLAVFPQTLSAYLPSVLNRLLAFDSSVRDTLILLVKQFRVADHVVSIIEGPFEPESVLTVSLSFYNAGASGYRKISSVEDVFAEAWPSEVTAPAIRRNKAIIAVLQRLFQNQNWATSGNAFSLAQVKEGIRKRADLPVFSNAPLVAGAYRSFDEFKNNAPSLFDIRIGRTRDGTIGEIRDAQDRLVSPQEIWGCAMAKNATSLFRKEFIA